MYFNFQIISINGRKIKKYAMNTCHLIEKSAEKEKELKKN